MNHTKLFVIVSLLAIFFIGFLLRAQESISGNFLFLKDQGRDMLDVKSIVIDKKLTLIGPYTGMQAVFQGPLYYYLLSLPFFLSGGNPQASVFLMLLLSLATIALGYFLGKKFWSPNTGLIMAYLFAVSPGAAAAATFSWAPNLMIPLGTLYIYFLISWLNKKNIKHFIFMTICLGLMFHFEIAFAFPLTIATWLIWMFLISKGNYFKYNLIFVLIIILFLSPLIIFDFRHSHLTLRSLVSLLTGGHQGLGDNIEPYTIILRSHLISFLSIIQSSFTEEKPVAQVLTYIIAILGIIYVFCGKDLRLKILFLLPVILYGVYLLYPYHIWGWYLQGMFPIYIVILGILLGRLVTSKLGIITLSLLTLVLLQNAIFRINVLYTKHDDGGTSKIKGKIQALDYIYNDAGKQSFNVLVFTPVVLTDAYDYLFWWYGKQRYGFLPGKDKQGIFYLLIEPDPGKPWSYKGWLETVIKTGKILDTKELPSGFIIHKRLSEQYVD